MSPQKHPAVLLAVTPLIVLFWDRTADVGRRDARVIIAALLGVLFYSAISPVRNAYHAIPQVAVAALGVTYLVIQILRFGGQQTRLTVGALALTFLFFGASARPLSLTALRPDHQTYGLREAVRLLRTGEMARSTPLGYFSDYPWADHRALRGVLATAHDLRHAHRQPAH